MNGKQRNYIDSLDLESLQMIDSILDDDSKEAMEYLTSRLKKLAFDRDIFQESLRLSTTIPISYVPIFGINLRRGLWKDCSIFDYYSIPEEDKTAIPFFNSVKVSHLNGAVDFTLKHLQKRVEICKTEHRAIPKGIDLLNENLEEKKELVTEQLDDIVQVLAHYGESYIFFIKNMPFWLSDPFFMSQNPKFIEMLARYSDLEDLKSRNVNSFQKFIQK